MLGFALVLPTAILLSGCGDRERGAGQGGIRTRGVIEGFYGQPYSHAERLDLIRFLGARGMNAYFYAPKNDLRHRDQWRDPYPPEDLRAFGELASAGDAAGVRFTFAVSPGLSYDPADPADFSALEAKLRSLAEVGVRGFSLLFDDLFSPAAASLDPGVQAELISRTAALVADLAVDASFSFIGNDYAGSAAELRAGTGLLAALAPFPPLAYYDAYAARVPADVPVLWTGLGVFTAHLTLADALGFGEIARRPVLVWDNFPVNDTLPQDLFLGPYGGRDADLAAGLDGFLLNLMSQPRAGRIALATAAEYLRAPGDYDPEAAWRRALAEIGGDARVPLERFASWNRGHPILGGGVEAPELARLVAATFADAVSGSREGGASAPGGGAGGRSAGAPDVAALREHLMGVAAAKGQLREGFADAAFLAEVAPWLDKAGSLAAAGLLGLDAIEGGEAAASGAEAAPRTARRARDDRTACAAYFAARDAARAMPGHVAEEVVSPSLSVLAGGAPGNPASPIGQLFAGIEAHLPSACHGDAAGR